MAMSTEAKNLVEYITEELELDDDTLIGKIEWNIQKYEEELIAETRRILLECATEAIERAYVEGQ